MPEIVEWGKGDAPITSGKTVTVWYTPAQKAQLWLESHSYDSLRHIAGGRTFADRAVYSRGKKAEAFARGTTVKITPEGVQAMTRLPERQPGADQVDRFCVRHPGREFGEVHSGHRGDDKPGGRGAVRQCL